MSHPVSEILIFYHFVSFVSRLLSGVSDFGLRPLTDLRYGGEAEYTSGRRGVAQGFRRNLSGA